MKLSQKTAGLSLGSLFGLIHFAWVVVVAAGVGGKLMGWWDTRHFITVNYTVDGFSIGAAIFGVILAFVCGFVIGWIFAWLWNYFEKQ